MIGFILGLFLGSSLTLILYSMVVSERILELERENDKYDDFEDL